MAKQKSPKIISLTNLKSRLCTDPHISDLFVHDVLRVTGNLQQARAVASNSLSVYDMLKYDSVIVTKQAVEKIEEVYA